METVENIRRVPVMEHIECFIFLNELRDSGKVNMFEGAIYLQEQFDLNRQEAKDIWLEWAMQFKRKE